MEIAMRQSGTRKIQTCVKVRIGKNVEVRDSASHFGSRNNAHVRMFVQQRHLLTPKWITTDIGGVQMRVSTLLRTTALAAGLIAASVPFLSVPANAAWGGWHGNGWGWGGVGIGLAAGALVGAALTAPYWGYGYGYPYAYGYGYPAYGYGYGYPASYGYGYGPSYGYGGYGYAYHPVRRHVYAAYHRVRRHLYAAHY